MADLTLGIQKVHGDYTHAVDSAAESMQQAIDGLNKLRIPTSKNSTNVVDVAIERIQAAIANIRKLKSVTKDDIVEDEGYKLREFGEETKNALRLFIDTVNLRSFNKNLRKIQTYFLLGMIKEGWHMEEDDEPLIKALYELAELVDVLEEKMLRPSPRRYEDYPEDVQDAFGVFMAVDMKSFSKNLRKIQSFLVIGILSGGGQINEIEVQLIKQLDRICEFVDVLENEPED